VLAKDFARIHWQNLVNFGILPLTFHDPADYAAVAQGDTLAFPAIRAGLARGNELEAENRTRGMRFRVRHALSDRQVEMILSGSLISFFRSTASMRRRRPAEG
jgi:aconitate hydratase